MAKKPLPLRIDEGLLARVDAARGDVSRTRWVERALESALRVPPLDSLGPSPSPALVKAAAEESMRQWFVDGALERVEKPRPKPAASRVYSCPKAGCIYAASEPGVCVHHRTERLR